ncbi:hypothetical protein DC58_13445 [Vibrio navarrensis]|nr:hypothetical protein EA24_07665 [Vibrio navarrensis]KGK23084.1 hypothetical protein DC58_13445 [Vibrio navarrensis]
MGMAMRRFHPAMHESASKGAVGGLITRFAVAFESIQSILWPALVKAGKSRYFSLHLIPFEPIRESA